MPDVAKPVGRVDEVKPRAPVDAKEIVLSTGKKPESPGSVTETLRSIWRLMTSMCLSLMSTPCER